MYDIFVLNKMMCFRSDCWRWGTGIVEGSGGRPASCVKFVVERIGWIAVGRFDWSPTTVLGSLCWLFIKSTLLLYTLPFINLHPGPLLQPRHYSKLKSSRYTPLYTYYGIIHIYIHYNIIDTHRPQPNVIMYNISNIL